MQILANTINKEWPEHKKQCPAEIQEYWNYRNELAVYQGILLKGDRIIIPGCMRQEIMTRLHTAHLGIVKTKQRACSCVFWLNITADITKYISGCEICQRSSDCQPKKPLMNSEIPEYPWEHMGTDLLFWEGRNYLVTTDYCSRYIELDKLGSTSSGAIITKLKSQFARHGIPGILTSDNAPPPPPRSQQTNSKNSQNSGESHTARPAQIPSEQRPQRKSGPNRKKAYVESTDWQIRPIPSFT